MAHACADPLADAQLHAAANLLTADITTYVSAAQLADTVVAAGVNTPSAASVAHLATANLAESAVAYVTTAYTSPAADHYLADAAPTLICRGRISGCGHVQCATRATP
jgi:predicted TIM-barrel enzyme